MLIQMESLIIFDSSKKNATNEWRVVDDVVMGGRSDGHVKMSTEGHLVFYGDVSQENNGGFSSMRNGSKHYEVQDYRKVVLRLRGDGKEYQLRIKEDRSSYYTYRYIFSTSGEWETIEIPLDEMVPVYRGRRVDLPNFNHNTIAEVGFLIANKRAESFSLSIDQIIVE
jgi:hypothetical protein